MEKELRKLDMAWDWTYDFWHVRPRLYHLGHWCHFTLLIISFKWYPIFSRKGFGYVGHLMNYSSFKHTWATLSNKIELSQKYVVKRLMSCEPTKIEKHCSSVFIQKKINFLVKHFWDGLKILKFLGCHSLS